ncbi:hypothetical protein A4A49_61112, partial [Nicotiana attenuata]
QVEEEEEDYADSIQDDSDNEAAQFSATRPSKDEAAKVQSEQVSNSIDSEPRRRGLSPNAPAFVPSKQQQIVAALEGVSLTIQDNKEVAKPGQQRALSAAGSSSMHNFDATESSSAMDAKHNLTPTNILYALVSGKQQIQPTQETTHDLNALMTQEFAYNSTHAVNVGKDIYEKGEEDEMLQQCRAEAAKRGDL